VARTNFTVILEGETGTGKELVARLLRVPRVAKQAILSWPKVVRWFLDEIGNLSPMVQMKALRSLQERCVLPLGSAHSLPIDVRLVVASNVILEEEVCTDRFRADLFHRLNESKIELLPLRERREDIHASILDP